MPKGTHSLTARDREMLKFVARYRLATDDLFRREFFRDVQDQGPVRKVAARLVSRNYLREYEFRTNVRYYVLAPRACRALGLRPQAPRPFTEQSLPPALAIAYFCTAHGLVRYSASEFEERFPEFCRPGLPASAYFMETRMVGLYIGFFLVDRGVSAKGMLAKIRKAIGQRYRLRPFASLIQAGRFSIAVLTGLPAKKRELEETIRDSHRGPVRIRVELVPELGTLLTRG